MTETDEALIEIMAIAAFAASPHITTWNEYTAKSLYRRDAVAALAALRAAGYTIAPPGALVIPSLDTPKGREAVEEMVREALDSSSWSFHSNPDLIVEGILRAALGARKA